MIKTNGEVVTVTNPSNLPNLSEVEHIEEPIVKAYIYTPPEYIGPIMELCQDKRGEYIDMVYLDKTRVKMYYEIPLNEIVYDFFDGLKSRTRGYASLDYEIKGYKPSDLVKLDIMLNNEVCDALSIIVHRDKAYARGRSIAEKLKEVIPRQMFEIPIQAAVGSKIIARETVKALRKDVLASATEATFQERKNCLKNKRKVKSVCARSARSRCPAKRLCRCLNLISKSENAGIYVHFPYCRSKCSYCAFVSSAWIYPRKAHICSVLKAGNCGKGKRR